MVCYAASRMEGDALEVIMSHTNEAEELTIVSPTAFIEILKTSFGDPDPKGTARRALGTFKQGKGAFATNLT